MKKVLVSLLVLALCAPAMAATVAIVDNADGTGTVTVTAEGGDNIVGLALDIDVVSGGNITATTVDTALFDIHPDAAHDMELGTPGSYTYGAGTAIANQSAVGEAAVSNSFAVSVGSLNGASTPGATGSASVQLTVTVDADTTISVKENALRGGIVLTTGAGEDITNGTAGVVEGTITVGSAYCGGGEDAGFMTEWDAAVTAGLDPSCWCNPRQCRGDADNAVEGKTNVYCASADLAALVDNWNKPYGDPGLVSACADFDHLSEGKTFVRVASNDLAILVANWNLSLDTNPPAACAYTTGIQP